jgi:Uncharacterized conserved protein (DUF2303)
MSDIKSADTVKAIYDQGRMAAPVIERPDGGKVILAPKGSERFDVEPLDKALLRIRQSPHVHDLESFIGYLMTFKTERTRVFAEPGHLSSDRLPIITAALDYHGPGTPDHLAHKITFRPRYSEPWTRWLHAKPMLQVEFAEFIEENRGDIRVPEAAQLLDIIRTFKASRKQDYDSVVYQPNGDVMINYSDTTLQAGKGVPVPSELQLGIPVYFRGLVYAVPVFMRYKVDGKVTFSLKVDRADYIEEAAFNEITMKIRDEAGVPVHLGRIA